MIGLLFNLGAMRAMRSLDVARGVAAAMAGGEAVTSLLRQAGVPEPAIAKAEMEAWTRSALKGGQPWR